MIVWSHDPLEVGKVHTPKGSITDSFSERHAPQPLFVKREATYMEWIEDVEKNGGDASFRPPGLYYYEVHTD